MENKDKVQQITEDLLSRLGISGNVSVDIDETEAFRVHIETEETGLLIGFHGRTLESLQIILGIIVVSSIPVAIEAWKAQKEAETKNNL